ncbi:MAG: MarR family transcriptional regulator [Devosia sp.]|nr:MarR family transcriptional regulator [Devosia sp.]
MQISRRPDSAGYLTNYAARLFARALQRRIEPMGFSLGYMPILLGLADGTPKTQKELAELASIEQPTMAATLTRMERDGLIRRDPDPADGRSALISLLPPAEAGLTDVLAAGREVSDTGLAALAPAEAELYLSFLERIIVKLKAADSA